MRGFGCVQNEHYVTPSTLKMQALGADLYDVILRNSVITGCRVYLENVTVKYPACLIIAPCREDVLGRGNITLRIH